MKKIIFAPFILFVLIIGIHSILLRINIFDSSKEIQCKRAGFKYLQSFNEAGGYRGLNFVGKYTYFNSECYGYYKAFNQDITIEQAVQLDVLSPTSSIIEFQAIQPIEYEQKICPQIQKCVTQENFVKIKTALFQDCGVKQKCWSSYMSKCGTETGCVF